MVRAVLLYLPFLVYHIEITLQNYCSEQKEGVNGSLFFFIILEMNIHFVTKNPAKAMIKNMA